MSRSTRVNFRQAMRMMRKHDALERESGFYWLQPHAAEFLPQLLAELETETTHSLRCWLLELIGDARSPDALPVFVRHLDDPSESIRDWSIRGLRQLDSKQARTILWERGLT